MRKAFILFLLLTSVVACTQTAQNRFSLTDTSFKNGAVFTTPVPISIAEGHSLIRPEEQASLDSIADLIVRNPGLILMIGCHSDQRGFDTANVKFTQLQANKIATYLRSRGVPYYDVAPVGFGERFPVHAETEIASVTDKLQKEKLYAENRRVECTILQTPKNSFTLTDTTFLAGATLCYPFKFILGKAQLDSSNFPFLDSLATFLLKNPGLEIKVENHLDLRTSNQSSNHLSMNRSQSIVNYLFAKGVDAQRMMAYGLGDVRPVVNETIVYSAPGKEGQEVLHAVNRRTIIRIVKTGP